MGLEEVFMTISTDYEFIKVDVPAAEVLRITLNRPEARNALSNKLRGELFDALHKADQDDAIGVIVIRGDEKAFSAGYDLKMDLTKDRPYPTAPGLGPVGGWARHVVEGSFKIWDLAKPVIAQVSGYCLAGGLELAHSCDLIYTTPDAKFGYPAVRMISTADNHFFPWVFGIRRSMELMLTGDSISGSRAVEWGLANAAYPLEELEERVLEMAVRVAAVPRDIQQFNKRAVHRQMDLMGIRSALLAGADMQELSSHSETAKSFGKKVAEGGLTKTLSERDGKFGDGRTAN